jgi:hypothetical protein
VDPNAAAGEPAAHLPEGEVHLIRHAIALDRRSWSEPDERRPLDARGVAQAGALAERYRTRHPDRIVSSPALRCTQTLQPTADAWTLPVEPVRFLEEGSPPEEATAGLLDALTTAGDRAVAGTGTGGRPDGSGPLLLACTHGDVLEGVIDLLLRDGVVFDGPVRTPKSVTYELEVGGGDFLRARVVAPPAPPGR